MIETPSLLITDDDRDVRETLRDVFQSRGFLTQTAGDGEEALRIVRNQEIHLVLIDMHMPRLTGIEAITRLGHDGADYEVILGYWQKNELGGVYREFHDARIRRKSNNCCRVYTGASWSAEAALAVKAGDFGAP